MINKILNRILNWHLEKHPKNLKAEKNLHLTKGSQKETFNLLKDGVKSNYRKIEKDYGDFVLPFWTQSLKKIEKMDIGFNFLKIPEIEGTMVITKQSRLMRGELKYLEKKINGRRLKELLEEDSMGSPKIINHKYKTSHNQIHNLYHLTKYVEYSKINLKHIREIVEWGGGYGCLAKIIQKIKSTNLTYTIIDLPLFSCIQWAYLSTVLGKDKVNLIKTKGDKIIKGKINLLPISLLKNKKIKAEMFISNWALSESSIKAQNYVISKDWFGAKYIFVGFQQSDKIITDADYLRKILNKYEALIKDSPLQKRNYYGILVRNKNE